MTAHKDDRLLLVAQKLYDALKRIARYQTPAQLHRSAQKQYGLESYEAIEYAYENVLCEAKDAIKWMGRQIVRAAAKCAEGEGE